MSQSEFADRARAARKKLKMTQQQVADGAHVGLRTVQTIETGQSAGTPANRRAIARVLGFDEDGNDIAAETRAGWPKEVQVFIDVIGAYLMTMPEERRLQVIHDLTRQIFEAHA